MERIIAWVATQRGRRITLRYLGVAKNHAWLRNRAAAINLRTLVNAGLTRRDGAWALADGKRPLIGTPPVPNWYWGRCDNQVDYCEERLWVLPPARSVRGLLGPFGAATRRDTLGG